MDCFQVRRMGAPLRPLIVALWTGRDEHSIPTAAGGGDTFEPDTSTARSFGAVVPGLDCKGSGNALKLNEVKARWPRNDPWSSLCPPFAWTGLFRKGALHYMLAHPVKLLAKKDSKTLLRLLNFTFNSVCVSYRLLNLHKATDATISCETWLTC